MKSRLDEMNEIPEFKEFMKSLEAQANYFVATYKASDDQYHAIRLCVAMAFEAGLRRSEEGKE